MQTQRLVLLLSKGEEYILSCIKEYEDLGWKRANIAPLGKTSIIVNLVWNDDKTPPVYPAGN